MFFSFHIKDYRLTIIEQLNSKQLNAKQLSIMTPFIAEIIGTAVLVLLGGGVVANVVLNKTIGNNSSWLVITTGWALAVYVAVVITGPYTIKITNRN